MLEENMDLKKSKKWIITCGLGAISLIVACNSVEKESTHQAAPISKQNEFAFCDNIDSALKHKDEVTHLYVRNYHETTFPAEMSQLSKLEQLSISNAPLLDLKIVFRTLSKMRSLRVLEIMNTKITTVPEQIGDLTNLHTLILSHDSIRSVPEEIYALSNLKLLFLHGNLLTNLPSISKSEAFNPDTVNLDMNKFTIIPSAIVEMKSLVFLSFEHNNLKSVTDSLGRLNNLKKLNIGGNPVSEEAKHIFKKTKKFGKLQSLFDTLPDCQINIYLSPM
jgi:Leucine-rich repeat (LRR) protein